MHSKQTLFNKKWRWVLVLGGLLLLFFLPDGLSAHVKWFSQFSFVDEPRRFSQILTPVYYSMMALSVFAIGLAVYLERTLADQRWYRNLNTWLSDQQAHSMLVMRVAMAGVLLISWSSDAVLTPELSSPNALLDWLEFVLAIGLLFPSTTWLSGAGLILLYLLTIVEFGIFHMLDYLHYAGIGIYFYVSRFKDDRIRGLALPALYVTIGFSLIWLGYEKLVYPDWALYLLDQNPQLTLGLNPGFFLQAAAFVELALGYLLIIGLLERPLAATITLVFFLTTLIFGKIEVIGHTPLHAALIIFLFNGPGAFYKPPIAIHEKLNWRIAFGTVNFVILMILFGLGYTASARAQFNTAVADLANSPDIIDLSGAESIPNVANLEAFDNGNGSWTLNAEVENWVFTPELIGGPTFPSQGYATVYDNGQEIGRMVGPWFDLGELTPGNHTIAIVLSGNDGTHFTLGTERIGAEIDIVAQRPERN
ncbi:MAG: DoxX family membrane protein [Chloroflexota bacterium]